MNLKAGREVINLLTLAHYSDLPVLIEGPPGVGKSDLIKEAAEQLEIKCIVRDLSLMEPPDLIGLPTQKNDRTSYAPPEFLPKDGRGFLVFEELNRSEKYMMSPCLQLLTARCLNDYRLPDGWLPIAAINPAGEAYDVNELDPALLSRFMRVQIRADVETWLEWAESHDVHAAVRQFVGAVKDVFESSNPRSWTYVSKVLVAQEAHGIGVKQTLMAALAGLVGETHAIAFLKKYHAGAVAITIDDVLRKYTRVKATVVGWAKTCKTDSLQSITHNMLIELQNSDLCAKIRSSKIMTNNLMDFIGDLPAEFARKVRVQAKNGGALK